MARHHYRSPRHYHRYRVSMTLIRHSRAISAEAVKARAKR